MLKEKLKTLNTFFNLKRITKLGSRGNLFFSI
jgi:hypothetical protein